MQITPFAAKYTAFSEHQSLYVLDLQGENERKRAPAVLESDGEGAVACRAGEREGDAVAEEAAEEAAVVRTCSSLASLVRRDMLMGVTGRWRVKQ